MDHQHQSSGRELGGEEINHEEGQELDTTTNSSYDCRFCNRNFTNAQALAGHMNLHPRARGKAAKQAPPPRSSSQATSSSSEEINNDGQELDSTKRSYDCRFCKRGFTNAQALGGHMSIHRRDRAKAAMQAPTNPDHLNLIQSWGADLTLRTGSSNYYQVDEEIKNVGSRRVVSMEAEEELDLELRLGHHP